MGPNMFHLFLLRVELKIFVKRYFIFIVCLGADYKINLRLLKNKNEKGCRCQCELIQFIPL